MSYQEILSMLQETHSHVEKELEGYRSKVVTVHIPHFRRSREVESGSV